MRLFAKNVAAHLINWLKGKWSYECKECHFRTSLRSGTIMESPKLSFLIWYKAMFLISCTKKRFSAKEMQKQLGLKRYEPVWAMVHKLRKAMGKRYAKPNHINFNILNTGKKQLKMCVFNAFKRFF